LRLGFQDQQTKVTEIDAKLVALSALLQSVNAALLGSAATGSQGDLIYGKPLPDVVKTLSLQVEVIQSRIKSQSVHMVGISFESYEDTYCWVCTHLNENDWTYILDMPGLYSLVRRDGKTFPSQLEQEANAFKAGYGNANNSRLVLSFNSMIPDIFEPGKKSKAGGHPFPAIDTVNKWESSGIQKGFRDVVEDNITALARARRRHIETHLMHRPEPYRLFSAMLTQSVDQTNALHHMLDKKHIRYREIYGVQQSEGNWTLICLFAEAALFGAWKARLVGAEAFSETTDLNTRRALFLWAALQCHRVMYEYVDMSFVNHPEISAVIVERLIKTRVPLDEHQKLKDEVDMCRSTMKVFTSSWDKMESHMGRAELDIKKKKNKD
jgi:hypothetical protein